MRLCCHSSEKEGKKPHGFGGSCDPVFGGSPGGFHVSHVYIHSGTMMSKSIPIYSEF